MKKSILFLMLFLLLPLSISISFSDEIHDSAMENDIEKVKKLVSKDPTLINKKDNLGRTPLYFASWGNSIEIVKFLLSSGAILDEKDFVCYETALFMACSSEVANLLLMRGADVNAKNKVGETPLHHARSKEIAKRLVSSGADVNSRDDYGYTPLHAASRNGEITVAEFLISKGADVNAMSISFLTPLHSARGKDLVKLLVSNGANINAKTLSGDTPLSLAVELPAFDDFSTNLSERKEIIDFLIANGAKIENITEAIAAGDVSKVKSFIMNNGSLVRTIDDYGTPLQCSVYWDRIEVAELLIANVADVNGHTKIYGTPLRLSSKHGNSEMTKLLIANGADVNAKDQWGRTPLSETVMYGYGKGNLICYDLKLKKYTKKFFPVKMGKSDEYIEIAKLLISKGADVNIKHSNSDYREPGQPIHMASMKGWCEMVDLLLDAGSDKNAKHDLLGYTPLHFAVEFRNKEVVELLITKGVDMNIKDKEGKTPLKTAIEKGYPGISDLLRKHGAKE